jgi:Fur family ferric uptake transcriptional regulator
MEEAKKVFIEYLTKYKLCMTNQRELLFDLLIISEGHISADEFFVTAKTQDPTLGVATIYRFLKLLRKAGLADEIIFGEGKVQ